MSGFFALPIDIREKIWFTARRLNCVDAIQTSLKHRPQALFTTFSSLMVNLQITTKKNCLMTLDMAVFNDYDGMIEISEETHIRRNPMFIKDRYWRNATSGQWIHTVRDNERFDLMPDWFFC